MTFTITHEETGRVLRFTSEAAFDDATVWAASVEKHTMLRFWTNVGHKEAELLEPTRAAMVPDWQEIIMEAWAAQRSA